MALSSHLSHSSVPPSEALAAPRTPSHSTATDETERARRGAVTSPKTSRGNGESRPRRVERRYPIGAEVIDAGVSFRVWSPVRERVAVVLDFAGSPPSAGVEIPLDREAEGYFSGIAAIARAGDLYRFRLDADETLYPDPASRFQPEGPHGPSQIVDCRTFAWSDSTWRGVPRHERVVYEMHVGTFTPEGTWAAARERLPQISDVGVTLVEVMPVADFCGDFGWGYDGVDMFAPTRLYGTPDDFRRFVDRAHALGMGVVLDVVYNHFGPDGSYVKAFSPWYFTDRHKTDWGEAINYDGENSGPVREFVATNAAYWIDEFHLDGLRLDATQDIHDKSREHILGVISQAARRAAGERPIFLVGENEPQQACNLQPPESGGFGLDALWNDDLHHTAMVALTGRSEAYYTDYRGTPQEFISAMKRGYLYQGQWYHWQKKRRGTSTRGIDPSSFVTFLQNHDQVANSGFGRRSHMLACPARHRALTALILLGPGTPMLFQGQDFAASAPFLYFAAHPSPLSEQVRNGRKEFLAQFPSLANPSVQQRLSDPADAETFRRCRLDWSERDRNAWAVAFHRDLLRLRREDAVLSALSTVLDGAVLGEFALALRWFSEDGSDRLLVVNLGADLALTPAPEPLLAEPEGHWWEQVLSSEHPTYGGEGPPPVCEEGRWFLPANSATFFTSLRSGPQ